MKKMLLKLTVPAVVLAVLAGSLTACSNPSGGGGDGGPPVVRVTGVSLNKATLTLGAASGTETLIATIAPPNAANKTVSWESDHEDVATVDDDGMVTAVAVGSATITVTTEDGGYTDTCTVTVTDYGISLDQSGTVTFPAAIDGYGAQTPKTITVSNTGTQETGALTVALSGTNDSDFTLSTLTINSIAVDGSDTFTVVPNTGLSVGTYTATVTVSGGNDITADFTVNPTPAYDISLDQSGTLTFTEAVAGYGEQAAQTITVSNTGTQETGALTVALSGTNDSDFTLSTLTINSIAVGGSDTFTVVPKTGLSVGTYTATVTVSGDNGISATFTVSFTVVPASITETAQGVSYTLKGVPGGTIPAGTTWGNGSTYPLPQTISVFYMGETEITYELWKAVYDWATDNARGTNQYTFANPGREGSNGTDGAAPTTASQEPVTYISWRDAIVWCNAYSEAAGKTPVYTYNNEVLRESEGSTVSAGSGKAEQAAVNTAANGFRLPTEAEWEYAARGGVPGTGTPWTYTYAGSNTADDVAVYQDNSGNKTAAVKSKAGGDYNGANSLGLYDMSGNVWEWCQDIYSGASRVIRGGSWLNGASYCAVAYRNDTGPGNRGGNVGLRLAACSP